MAIIGGIIAVLAFIMVCAAQAQHRRETGVGAPSRGARARIRRQARKNGQTESEAYEAWLGRKQKLARGRQERAAPPPPAPIDGLAVTYVGIEDGEARFSFHCKACGGYILPVADESSTPDSQVICKACDLPLGTLAEVQVRARQVASGHGVRVGPEVVWRDDLNNPVS